MYCFLVSDNKRQTSEQPYNKFLRTTYIQTDVKVVTTTLATRMATKSLTSIILLLHDATTI